MVQIINIKNRGATQLFLVSGLFSLLMLVACEKQSVGGVGQPSESQSSSELSMQKALSLEEWEAKLRRKSPNDVKAMLGAPDDAEERTNVDGVVQTTIFEYKNLVLNKHTGKTEKLSIAFLYDTADRVKEGYGRELVVLR